ncbi:endoglucanase E-4-like [Schistocerca americana]|uniref:endoglucanase E-4-like n=1 Tax=Schistocerca americana TaxID=7009 RepID=UPI001F4FD6BB|nr:endoglucanase E-4-like [Schistocerca americana]XP_047097358.1 endoglucanase E-4-like [Schistocerca piceifrons]XP_049768246.1 endoglucanase E-4-like isoform X1 [Schistocerca cancellata]XP_049768247.1 endoglucanase E-4-like isoform X1 [Schistocerca cancellata]XP_049942221.1 endoglucanase E-4-like [Schistocerca serialis cubense]
MLWTHVVLLSAACSVLATPLARAYSYDKVLSLSLLFYEAQRSGRLPADNRISWRGDSALEDRGQRGEDLSGGYYDAGDFVKFGFTMASTTTLLAWGLLSYKEAYKSAGQLQYAVDAVKWATDYFIKCHVAPTELYGQVGDFDLDHKYWGRPEELNMSRPAFKIDAQHPGSDLAGETAAALAAASLVFRGDKPEYADLCLRHARELYHFANQHRGLYHESIRGAEPYYESTDYGDELTWAAAWLYKATNESQFLDEAEHHYMKFRLKERPNEFFYNKKVAGVQVLMAQLTKQKEYVEAAQAFCDFTVDHQKRTPKGLVYIDKFGTLCHAANVAFVCLQASEAGLGGRKYVDFARRQINYMLGDSGRSFVVGYGDNPPKQPYHAASSCPDLPAPCDWEAFRSKEPNPQVLYGALVSGPDENDFFEDKREEYVYTEVTLDYNAGFQSAVAGLLQDELRSLKVQ